MAEAIVSVLLEQLGNFLYHGIENEVTKVVGVKKEIQKLTETLTSIQAVLYDVEKKQFLEDRVKVWLEDLKEAVYEIEDVLDLWNTNLLKSPIKNKSLDSSKNVCSHLFYPCFCIKSTFFLRHSVGRKIKELNEGLKTIESHKNAYGLIPGLEANIVQPRDGTSSLVNVLDVYGREFDRDIIVEKILGESGHRGVGVPVISILGGGGLGKTTLAQYILHHEKVVEYFGKPLWVCVSESFDRTRLAKAIIFEVSGEVPQEIEWNALHHRLMETLKNKLFLLILDDVWTEDLNQWNPFKLCLNGGAAGSRILITTRKVRVAQMVSSIYTHPLQVLTDENSWSLLQFASSIGDETKDYETFENIGKAIALKCKGVPLSIITLGSLMRSQKTKHYWERVLESEMWSLPEFIDTVNPALSLSYYDLPSSWKPCFIYCATFPKDHILKKEVLIKLWMAHGFLHSSEGRELEEIGEEYFNGIAARSLFQDLDKEGSDDIRSCKMHDLVHDFVHFLSNKKACIIEGDDDVTFNNPKLHHLTVCSSHWSVCSKDITNVSSFDTMKSVRTLNFNNGGQVGGLKKILRHWTNLRSLDISNTYLNLLPPEIEKLIHLRYLDLSSNWLKKLPNTLGNLCNLQTLKLNGCSTLRELPASMGKLINLRHLELDDTYELRSLPKGIEKLSSLRSLSKFIVEEGRKLSDMKRLNLIQRKVEISGLCQVKDGDEAKEAELGSNRGIRDLTLNFGKSENENWEVSEGCERWIRNLKLNFGKYGNVSEGDEERMEGVLEALQPPPHLEELKIRKYPGSKLASWMNDTSLFLKLRVLELQFDEENKCIQVPSLGQLPLLEKLTISNMRSLQRLDLFGIWENKEDASNPIVAFPKLSELILWEMSNLEEWVLPFDRSDIIQIMPRIRILTIKYAWNLKALPPVWKLESLEELTICGLDSVTQLPCLGQLPLLEKLTIKNMTLQRLDLFGNSENKEDASNPIVAFPKLSELILWEMSNLEEWVLPFERSDIIQIMPCIRELDIFFAFNLKPLPSIWKLESLEKLIIWGLNSERRIGPELFGITENDVMGMSRAGESLPIIIFPKLKKLVISWMFELEEWEMKMPNWREDITFLMPCLEKLTLLGCYKLKVIPQNIFSYQLVNEAIDFCPELKHPSEGTNQIIKRKEVGESIYQCLI